MIDHLNIGVSDLAASRAFYEPALAVLGYTALMDRPYGVGFGKDGKPEFWISDRPSSAPLHVAFRARIVPPSMPSTARRWLPAGATTERPTYGPSTTAPTTARSCSTQTATTSRRLRTGRSDRALLAAHAAVEQRQRESSATRPPM